MGWTTNEENVEVISKEIVEDRDPQLYKKRAKVLAKQGMYNEADMEYDKSIQYGGGYSFHYIEKSLFWLGQGKNSKSMIALLMSVWKFFYRNIDVNLLYILLFIFSINIYGEINGIPAIILGVVSLVILIKRTIRTNKVIRDESAKKLSLGQHIINIILSIICAYASFAFVPLVFLLGYIPVIGVMFAINFLAVIFRGIRKLL